MSSSGAVHKNDVIIFLNFFTPLPPPRCHVFPSILYHCWSCKLEHPSPCTMTSFIYIFLNSMFTEICTQGFHRDWKTWKTWKMTMVMEKSWNMKNWPKIKFQSWDFTNFASKMYQICMFFATSKKLSIDVESLRFQTYSAKCRKCKIAKREDYGKLTNGHGKVMDKNIVKSVGTLVHIQLHVPSNQLPLPHFPNSIFHTGRVQTGSSLQYAYSIG